MGSIGESAENSFKAILERNKDAKIVIAVDNDEGGNKITDKLSNIIYQVDGNIDRAVREVPQAKDWNDDLKLKREQEKQKTRSHSRGMYR
jgi:DNA primase